MKEKLGPTGEYPEGKLNEYDKGGLNMAIGIMNNNVVIEFGTPVTWLGMPKKEATAFAKLILSKANEL